MNLEESFAMLNDQQLEAVEHLDGPLLVVAGPGTGKTQLLSLRAANILATCDAAPGNILCLTYTDAGVRAMRKRLIELIGRDAYGIEVSTFHGFASFVRSRYPQHFERPESDRLVTSLRQAELIDDILKHLPFSSPLSSINRNRVSTYTKDIIGFVSKVKRSGLSYDTLEAIAQQNIAAVEWLEENSDICAIMSTRASAKVAEKFETEVERACTLAPSELKRSLVSTPGTYVPFIVQFRDAIRRTELVNEDGKISGYNNIREAFFGGTNKDGRYLKVKQESEKLVIACQVARDYQRTLDENGLYDYDDMIFDFVHAVEQNGELRQALQDTYTYIQVDEFQDTNGAQMRIVELLCEGIENPNVMAVGDDDQAIMRFQGASVECINQFIELYRPRSIVLKTNYRSTPAVVNLGQKIAAQIEFRLDASEGKEIRAHKTESDQEEFTETVLASRAEEYAALARDIREKIDAGYVKECEKPDEAIAVIANKHKSLRSLIPHLVAQNIPFAYKQKQDLFTSERMQTTLALVRCVAALAQGRSAIAAIYLPQIVAAPELGGDHPSSVFFAMEAKREYHRNWLLAMSKTENERISGIYTDLMDWAAAAPSAPVRELLFKIAARPLAYYRRQAESDPLAAAEFNAGMSAMLTFVDGEIDAALDLGRALRLTDVVDRLDAAQQYGVGIDAGIELDAPGAVKLTSAHSSKGLEFDCVYLVDADDEMWHKSGSSSKLLPSNLLIDDEKDEDDARRLLFVAVTRAKRNLELYRAGSAAVRELSEEISSMEIDQDAAALDDAIEQDWHDSYALDTPELVALVTAKDDFQSLSASTLNSFVTYEEGCTNSSLFPERQVMRLPAAPSITTDFGTLVHSMLEDVVSLAMGPKGTDPADIAAAHRKNVEWMDFPEKDVAQYLQRFDRITDTFVPWLMENAADFRKIIEASLVTATTAGTPLYGRLDLMLVDDEAKTVRIVDFKTGLKSSMSDSYERQLRFYKMLVEASPEFEDYTVVSMGDYYVEPDKATGEVRPPLDVTAHADDIRELECLADAVWARIQTGAWDTSAFEQSERYEAAVDEQGACKNKADKARVMQQAYEKWLVEEGAQ